MSKLTFFILIVSCLLVGCKESATPETTSEPVSTDTGNVLHPSKAVETRLPPLFVFEKNDFGNEPDWTLDYLQDVHRELVKMMDAPDLEPPRGIKIILEKIDDDAALGGYATPDTIGFRASSWRRERYRLWILAHELCNLFANHYAGAGGFPSDWWSNGRSPFPIYASALICQRLQEQETAEWLRTVDAEKSDQQLYWEIHDKYGFQLFARFFQLLRRDGIDLGEVGGGDWPTANECRSAYAVAYLSLAADKNLARLFRRHEIGSKPSDWDQRHPDRPFVEYSISDREVDDIIAERNHVFGFTAGSETQHSSNQQIQNFRTGTNWQPID